MHTKALSEVQIQLIDILLTISLYRSVIVCRLANIVHHRSYNVQHRFAPLFCLTSSYWRQKKLIAKLHNFTDSVIRARRETLLDNPNILEQYDEELGKKKKMALLDILLQSKIAEKPLSNLDIREEIDTFMFEVTFTRREFK